MEGLGTILFAAGFVGLAFYVLSRPGGALSTVAPPPVTSTTTVGSFVPKSSNPSVVFFGTLGNIATHPTAFQNAVGLTPQTFQTFGDQSDFDRLMSNTHACQTGNEAACEAVWEQAPGMVCTPQFCDQDPTKNNGHGSAVNLGNGTMAYNQPGGIRSSTTYGKKVPVGGCFTTGRRWDVGGAANAQSNITGGYCTGLAQAPAVLA